MLSNPVLQLLDRAIAIQQIPAPTYLESQRAAFVKAQFLAENLGEVSIDPLGNVYGCLPATTRGARNLHPIVICAHLDTVFLADTSLDIRQETDRVYGPGLGDNSLGVAGLFGLLWALRTGNIHLNRDLWFVANVGEEGLGNLNGIRAVVKRFADHIQAYIILEGISLGHIYHRGLGVQRYRVNVHTPGGHSWVDYGTPSAIHELADLVHNLAAITLPKQPRTTLNVGVIAGGTTINTIAAHAYLEVDLRSESPEALQNLAQQVITLTAQTNRKDVEATHELIGERPAGAIPDHHWLVQLAKDSLASQGIKPNTNIGSTDANYPLSLGLPAVCIGLTTGGGAHTTHEYIDLHPLEQGLNQLVHLVQNVSAYQAD